MSENLLLNPAFDINPSGNLFTSNQNGTPDNWARTFSGGTASANLYNWFDARARQVSLGDTIQEVQMSEAAGVSYPAAGFTGILQLNLPAVAGTSYCFSLHTFVQFILGANSMKLQLTIQFKNAANATTGQADYVLTPTNYSDARNLIPTSHDLVTDVRRPYVTGTAPAGTTYAIVWILLINDTANPIVGTNTYAYMMMAQYEEGNVPTAWNRGSVLNFGGHEYPYQSISGDSAQIEIPYQYKFKNLLFGSDTGIIVESVEGLLGGAPVRDADADRSSEHGSFAGGQFLSKRTIAINLRVTGKRNSYFGNPDDLQTKLDWIKETFQPNRIRSANTPIPFYFWHRNQPRKFINARCTKREITSDYTTHEGPVSVAIELQATDPMIYSVFPKATSLVIPASNTVKVINLNPWGDAPVEGDQADGAAPVVEIFGPATNPVLGSQTENRYLRFQIALAAGHSLRINTKTKKVEKNIGAGYVEDYSIVRSDNQWFRLLPNIVNTLSFSRTDSPATTAKATVSWNDVWN